MQNINEIDYSTLTQNVADAAQLILGFCRDRAPDAELVALALCPDEDVRSMYWVANSSASVAADPNSEFEYYDWPLNDHDTGLCPGFDGSLGLAEIWAEASSFGLAEETWFDVYPQVRQRCLQAIADGLQMFRSVSLPGNDEFALLVCIPDDDPRETADLVKGINSAAVYERYANAHGL